MRTIHRFTSAVLIAALAGPLWAAAPAFAAPYTRLQVLLYTVLLFVVTLMPFLTLGWPDPAGFVETALEVARSGADLMELGMPFSDPVADGPTIQRTSMEALQNGITFA